MMQKLIAFLFIIHLLFPALYPVKETVILRGIVTLQNSNGTAIEDVEIKAVGTKSHATKTDHFGEFRLVLIKKKPGDTVVLTAKKPGLEVVNRKELTIVLSNKPDALVQIVMCPINERDKYARLYYGIAKEAINKNYEELLEKIEKLIDEREKYKALADLHAKKKAALSQAKDLAETFAKVNLDEASELYKEAFEYFKKGNIDKALQVLDDDKMEQALCFAKSVERKAKEAIKKSVDNYMLKARLCILKLKFKQAEDYYEKAINADPGNIESLLKFNGFLDKQNKYDKALALNKEALSLASNEVDRAAILNNSGVFYLNNTRFPEALTAYKEALEIYRKLAAENPNAYLPYVATTLNNLGLLYIQKNESQNALNNFNEALEIRKKLAKYHPNAFELKLCQTMISLCLIYTILPDKNQYKKKGRSMLNQTITI